MINTIGLGDTEVYKKAKEIIDENTNKLLNPMGMEYKDGQISKTNNINKTQDYIPPEETRADKIYEEQKEREDTAWQRGVKDMLASGVNPNLVNLSFNGATTGAGIMADQELQGKIDQILKNNEIELQAEVDKMLLKLDQEFKMNEAQKDRWNKSINQIISTVGNIIGVGMKMQE